MNNEKQLEPICYAIVLKNTKQVLSPDTIRQNYPNYGGNVLYGWKPPKKVYYKVGHAKSAYTLLPEKIRSLCVIVPLGIIGEELDMGKIVREATERREKKEAAQAKRRALRQAAIAERELAEARKTLAKYGVDK